MSQVSGEAAAGQSPAASRHDSRLLHLASALVRRRTPLSCAAWLASALAAATLLRMSAGLVTQGGPLVFYLPAVGLVALFTGWECGLIAVALSGALAWFLFVPPVLTLHSPNLVWALTLSLWMIIAGAQVAIAHFLRVALQRALHSEMRYRKLLDVISGSVLTVNEGGQIEAPQPGWTEITGTPWPEYGGAKWVNAIHPDDRPKLMPESDPSVGDVREAELRLWNAAAEDWRWYVARSVVVPRFSRPGYEWVTSLHDVHEQKLATDRRDMVIGELRHRLKNLLTIIDALAKNSRSRLETGAETEAFLKRFLGRLHALGAAADLVLVGNRVAIECGALVRSTLAPFMEERSARFLLLGGELQLTEETGGVLGLALHEMATNALKYGALSSERGTVSVHWYVRPVETRDEQVTIEWRESGGPRPVPPNREGFGTRLIRSVTARERSGEVKMEYRPDGFCCRISFLRPAEGPLLSEAAKKAAD
ncbi:MAG TPA: HWE histidine kinase domain-containing protein [Rhizomicrobium sp.]